MLNHVGKSREAPIVVEASLGVSPKAAERRSTIPLVRRTIRLEIVDADLCAGMHVPSRFGEERRDVARGAACRAVEQSLSPLRCGGIETARRRVGRGNS